MNLNDHSQKPFIISNLVLQLPKHNIVLYYTKGESPYMWANVLFGDVWCSLSAFFHVVLLL